MDDIQITATQINYHLICKRKLWLFSHQINMEHSSELVEIGKLIHEQSYAREKKEITIGPIKIDFIGSDGVVREIKKSSKMEEAHIWQLKYYLYYLKLKGVNDLTGELVYPKQKQKTQVFLTEEDEKELEIILQDIETIVSKEEIPLVINKTICRQCSYYELCYI
jgi:CRISPR-associated exonuclease Cas4